MCLVSPAYGLAWSRLAVVRRSLALAVACCALVLFMVPAVAARPPGSFKNCKSLHVKYAHGVGRPGARDHTTGKLPVTTFLRSRRLYLLNKGLDGDHDGVACEQA